MTFKLEQIVERLLCLLAVFIPLYILGFTYNAYDFSLALIVLIILGGVLLVSGKLNKYSFSVLSFFWLWCFSTSIFRHPIESFIPSLIALIVVTLPLSANWRSLRLNKNKIYKWFLWGFYLTLVVVLYEVICNIIGLDPFINQFEFGIFSRVRATEFLGVNRVKGLFLEPAHLAIYLVYIYVLVDVFEDSSKEKHIKQFFAIIVLLFTFSLSGIILLFVYLVGRYIIFNKRAILNFGKLSIYLILIITPIYFYYHDYFTLIFDRFGRTFEVLSSGSFSNTYGSRANAILVLWDYYIDKGFSSFLIGEGYANYQSWLEQHYSYLQWSSLKRGQLPNIFAIIGLSTGLVGLFFYISFIYTAIKKFCIGEKSLIILLFIFTHFAYGLLIGYFMWSLLLITLILNKNIPKPLIYNS